MNRTPNIGKRIELISMDSHFADISIGLYEQDSGGKPVFLVHTYSTLAGAPERMKFLVSAMKMLGDLATDNEGRLYFSCGDRHELAIKRIFVDSAKIPPGSDIQAYPLRVHDKKLGTDVTADSLGDGKYRLGVDGTPENAIRRITAIARGLARLGQMDTDEEQYDRVGFSCGQSHDAMVGLLLVRAPNVRAAMREVDMMEARGVLAAPGAQD